MRKHFIRLLALCIMLVGVYNLAKEYQDYQVSDQANQEVQDTYTEKNDEPIQEEQWYDAIAIDLEALQKENSDVIGWIYFENEDISYPILYSGDNSYYLRRTYKKDAATAGSIFMEGANTPDFNDMHTILYGHNMNNLSMFGKLKYYREKSYYQDHMFFQIHVNGMMYRYRIFAYKEVKDDDSIYTIYRENSDLYHSFLDEAIVSQTMLDTMIIYNYEHSVITLSTCAGEDKRFVVSAIREDVHLISTNE